MDNLTLGVVAFVIIMIAPEVCAIIEELTKEGE